MIPPRSSAKSFRSASCCLGLALFLAPIPSPGQGEKEARQLDALRSRIEQLRGRISAAEESRTEARDQLRESERAISDSNRVLRILSSRRAAASSEVRTLAQQIEALESDIASRQEALGRWLALRYIHGERGDLRLLLSGQDPNSVARELHYLGYISRAQADLIEELRAGLARRRQLEAQAREASSELATAESSLRRERGVLLRQQLARRKVLTRVSGQLREQRRQVKYLERDEFRLSRLVEEIGKVIASTALPRNEKLPDASMAQGPFPGMKGKLRLPVKGDLTNRFGTQRSNGGPAWKGLFIRSQAGQEVRAVAAGRVVFSDWLRGFGNLLIIDHGQSYLTIYGNNESVLKQVGDTVRGGDAVATVGASGGNLESGLYFEIRHQGKAFDPMRWVSTK
jgi:septal ring factor EnvC (AmiA/AmiB activator)